MKRVKNTFLWPGHRPDHGDEMDKLMQKAREHDVLYGKTAHKMYTANEGYKYTKYSIRSTLILVVLCVLCCIAVTINIPHIVIYPIIGAGLVIVAIYWLISMAHALKGTWISLFKDELDYQKPHSDTIDSVSDQDLLPK